jgi:hypothetical protein
MTAPDPTIDRPALTCDEVRPMLPQVAEGALDQAADPALFDHLARCHSCQDVLIQHDLIAVALERSRPLVAPPLRLQSARRIIRLPWPLAAAALLAVATGAWFAVRPVPPSLAEPVAEVIKVVDPATGAVRYVIRDVKGAYAVDPAAIDGRADAGVTRRDAQQVDLKR